MGSKRTKHSIPRTSLQSISFSASAIRDEIYQDDRGGREDINAHGRVSALEKWIRERSQPTYAISQPARTDRPGYGRSDLRRRVVVMCGGGHIVWAHRQGCLDAQAASECFRCWRPCLEASTSALPLLAQQPQAPSIMKNAPYDEHEQPEGHPNDELSIVEELPQKRATFGIFHAVSVSPRP